MTPLEKRLKELKDNLDKEIASYGDNTLYAQDLRFSISECERDLKNVSKDGYRMVTL